MQIKPSTLLRNDYAAVSRLAHETGEPVFITKNGEGDLVIMSIEAFDKREKLLEHRALMLEAEFSRASGETSLSLDEIRHSLQEGFRHE